MDFGHFWPSEAFAVIVNEFSCQTKARGFFWSRWTDSKMDFALMMFVVIEAVNVAVIQITTLEIFWLVQLGLQEDDHHHMCFDFPFR